MVSMAEAVQEAALGSAARALVGKAGDWWTVAYVVPAVWRKVEGTSNLVVCGWRGSGRFMAVWQDGSREGAERAPLKADCAYWWTREHEAWAELPRELVRWTTARPMPVKVSFAELKRLIALPPEVV